jgi:hypothetical protein
MSGMGFAPAFVAVASKVAIPKQSPDSRRTVLRALQYSGMLRWVVNKDLRCSPATAVSPDMGREGLMARVELPGFDTLRYLAEHDPERLEHLRNALTEMLIARSPAESQQRLRGLQFQINARIKLAPNPIAACIAVSAMMHDTLEQLQRTLCEGADDEITVPASARIIPFRQRS